MVQQGWDGEPLLGCQELWDGLRLDDNEWHADLDDKLLPTNLLGKP